MQINNELLQSLIVWVSIFGIAWLVWIFLLFEGIDYVSHFVLASFYFLGFFAVAALVFRDTLRPIVAGFPIVMLIPIGAVLALQFLSYFLTRRFLSKPEKTITKYPKYFNLKMNYYYILPKYSEILFQQIMIVVLVLLLKNSGLNLVAIIIFYTIAFGVLHLPLVKIVGKFFGIYYTLFAMVSGLIFPILITQVKFGFIYTYTLHCLFYIATGIFFWIYFAKVETNN